MEAGGQQDRQDAKSSFPLPRWFGDNGAVLEMEAEPDPRPLSRQIQRGRHTSAGSRTVAPARDGWLPPVIFLLRMGTCALASKLRQQTGLPSRLRPHPKNCLAH
jgi:hypothetical protein